MDCLMLFRIEAAVANFGSGLADCSKWNKIAFRGPTGEFLFVI